MSTEVKSPAEKPVTWNDVLKNPDKSIRKTYDEIRQERRKKGPGRFSRFTKDAMAHNFTEEEMSAYSVLLNSPVYTELERIILSYIVFALGNAFLLAIDLSFGLEFDNELLRGINFVSSIFGISLTAFFIHAVYKGLKLGVFRGLQKRAAMLFGAIAFVDESFAVMARFNVGLEPLYADYVLPLSAPAMCVFSIVLILAEPISRMYRAWKRSTEQLEHVEKMSKLERDLEKVRAINRERSTRALMVMIHALKLRARGIAKSVFSWWAWGQAGKQSDALLRDVVDSNKLSKLTTSTSSDGSSKVALEDLELSAGGSGTAKKTGGVRRWFRR